MSLKTGNHVTRKYNTQPIGTPYQAFGIQGNIGSMPIPGVPVSTPEELGYISNDMEAQIAAFNAAQQGVINPYADMTLPDISPSMFGDPIPLGMEDSIRGNNPYLPTPASTSFGDYFNLMLNKESSGNYRAVNSRGYIGGYQMREGSLIDAGLVKPGTTKKGLDNPKNWYGGLSKEKFLASPEIQDAAVRAFTEKNKKYLGSTYTNATESERRGLLASAHLIGAGGTKKNMNSKDGNGIKGKDYFDYFSTH